MTNKHSCRAPIDSAQVDGAPLDAAFLRTQTFGDRELEAEVLGLFIEQASILRQRLLDNHPALSDADLPGALHRLKGSAKAVGAAPLASALDDMEQVLASGGIDAGAPVRSALHHLRAALDDACSFAASLLDVIHRVGLAKRPESR